MHGSEVCFMSEYYYNQVSPADGWGILNQQGES